jgi:hypothetical protein
MNLPRIFAVLVLAGAAAAGEAAERRYSIGVHDSVVPDADSHTYGITGSVSLEKQTETGRHLAGSVDLFVDHDQDHLDPDHIPIWWKVHLGTDGDLWQAAAMHVGWTADVNTRMNTVSSVEREILAFPAITARYDGNILQPSLKAGAGWFFLEIDDDVPKKRGYDPDNLRNSTLAYEVAADLTVRIGTSWSVYGQAQQWRDSHDWLQTQYKAALRMDASHWMKGGELALSAEANEYNLDVYSHPGALPVLPWDDDLLIRVSLTATR